MGFFDDIGNQISSTWNDVTSTGVPGVIAGVEDYAAKQLAQQASANTQAASAAAQQVASRPGASTGVMANIQGVFSNIGQSVVGKQYGVYILLGAAALVVGGMMLSKKG